MANPLVNHIAIIGDSYTAGTVLGGKDNHGWPALVAVRLQADGVPVTMSVGGEGGAGYVHPGNRRSSVFGDLVATTVKSDDALVVIFGSRNDLHEPLDDIATAACSVLASAARLAPGASLLLIAPPWVDASPPEGVLAIRDVLRHQAGAAGSRVVFVDPLTDGWFADRPDLIGSDHIHPTDTGHQYMADRIAPLIEGALAK